MPITYCRDCVFCVVESAAASGLCHRHPPTVIVIDNEPYGCVPNVSLTAGSPGFCGDGAPKPAGNPAVHPTAKKGDSCYTYDCPGCFYPNEAGTCNCSQLTPRQECIGCMLVCNKCGRSVDDTVIYEALP